MTIGRKNDGKSLNPAVDLLPQKKDGDDDWDKDNDNPSRGAVKAAKTLDKDIAKAMKDVEKATAAASVNTKMQVEKIQPEITKLTAESVARAADAIEQTAQAFRSADFTEKIKDKVIKQKNVLAKIADIGYMPRIEKKTNTIPVKGVPKVTVDAKDCAIRIRGSGPIRCSVYRHSVHRGP